MMSGPRPLPNEVWILIAAAAAAAKGRHGIDSPQAWQYDPHDHPLLALSQTSRTLRAITAPLLWTNISLTGYDHQDKLPFEHGIELIRKLVVCLQQPIIRNTIQSFNFDIELTTDSPDDFDEQPDQYRALTAFPPTRIFSPSSPVLVMPWPEQSSSTSASSPATFAHPTDS
ncbi:hypothetical protein A4X06_0g9226 [Tilletia controversa]|uniref:F-box domain-containing protein n=1 Tax=Tilletia controversa TaxID=13291 RepID=A0A8X7MJD1_9BASI|nr:hypothetical protein A4X06_0g9226 [Tilletia controversa]